jgi:peptidoglycan/LPS O-acetylase OafA/YrhL
MIKNRNHGLDTLRSIAIILVFLFHYDYLSQGTKTFGVLGQIGYVGVDLFFVLSGYLIGNQIFSAIADRKTISLKNFYSRRLLRTLPNYLIVLSLYFLIPYSREEPLTTPLWQFLTFTQNFNLHGGAFTQAWSLCIEEQFYLFLPLIALLMVYTGSIRKAWYGIFAIILGGIIWRGLQWYLYIQHAGSQIDAFYGPKIYYPTWGRLDGLALGVSLAMLKNFHSALWVRLTAKGNVWFVVGLVGFCLSCYAFFNCAALASVVLGYPMRALCFAALTLAALSPQAWLSKTRIPGAMLLATLSYAIYLTHRQLIYLANSVISYWKLGESNFVFILTMLFCLLGAGLLYLCIESPFLTLRDRLEKTRFHDTANP